MNKRLPKIITYAQQRYPGIEALSDLLDYLKAEGCTRTDCIAVVHEVYHLSPTEAKKRVFFSPQWAGAAASTRELHQQLEKIASRPQQPSPQV